jgi:DNA repair exonuclease SbcCD nuclease subunit
LTRFVHCADLHLSRAESDYGLAVLDEVLEQTHRQDADALILAGDTFDSWADAEGLRGEFRDRLRSLELFCTVIMIAGNHERLGAPSALGPLDFGCPVYDGDDPFVTVRVGDADVLVMPYRNQYGDYIGWDVAPRNGPRLAVAHGSVAGLNFVGGEEEAEAPLDPDLFAHLQVDYAALGHIHSGRIERVGPLILAYPGSARVWRRGEEGPRRIIVIDVGTQVKTRWIELQKAGQYRREVVTLDLSGACPDLSAVAAEWGPHDCIDLELQGLVEDERATAVMAEQLRQQYGKHVRRIEVRREQLLVLEGIASEPVARRFLDLWREAEPDDTSDREIWLRARHLGLEKIKTALESLR